MLNGLLTTGEQVGHQTEDNFIAAQATIGTPNAAGGKHSISNVPIGSVAYGSLGTNTTDIAGQLWITDIFVPYNRIITTIGFLSGATSTTDNFLCAIYSNTGVLLASSALAGAVLAGGGSTFQENALVLNAAGNTIASLALQGPQQYFIAIQGNGTAAGSIATIATLTYVDVLAGVVSGTFGTLPNPLTVPTTFTAGKGGFVYVR